MSSQSKRRAESEEVAHKKKPRKGGDKEDHFNQDDDGGLDVEDALDKDNTIPTDSGRRGKRVDYAKVGPVDDNSFETGEEMSKENEGAPPSPRTRSPQRKPAGDIKEEDEEDDDDDDSEEGEYGEDDGTDEYYEDEEE